MFPCHILKIILYIRHHGTLVLAIFLPFFYDTLWTPRCRVCVADVSVIDRWKSLSFALPNTSVSVLGVTQFSKHCHQSLSKCLIFPSVYHLWSILKKQLHIVGTSLCLWSWWILSLQTHHCGMFQLSSQVLRWHPTPF